MSAIKVKPDQFSGTGHVHGRGPDHLAAIVRGIAIDNANLKVQAAAVHDFTDNSSGQVVSPAALPLLAAPSAPVNAKTNAVGATLSALNTSLGKTQNALKVMVGTVNEARPLIGLPLLVCAVGAVAAADTIPAQDKTNAATSGNTSANFASTRAALAVAANDLYMLAEGVNEVLVAVGATPIALPKVSRAYGTTLVTIPTVVADTDGSTAAAQSDVQGFLVAAAEAIATIAAAWNAVMTQSDAVPLHVIAG